MIDACCTLSNVVNSGITSPNKKHLKNVGPIRHSEPPHAALPFTRCHRLRIDVHNNNDDNDNE